MEHLIDISHPYSDSKGEEIHPDIVVPGKCHHTEIREGHKTDNQKKEKPEPEEEKYLLDDVVR